MSWSNRDKELLRMFGMTEEQVEHDEMVVESETEPDGVIGPVYERLHILPEREEDMVSMTVKLPKSQLARVTAAARRYHISRSEYVRRRLADA